MYICSKISGDVEVKLVKTPFPKLREIEKESAHVHEYNKGIN